MEVIRKKIKLRREKSMASANGDPQEVQRLQRQMNYVGGQIKKEQKIEEKLRHENACRKLATEKNPSVLAFRQLSAITRQCQRSFHFVESRKLVYAQKTAKVID